VTRLLAIGSAVAVALIAPTLVPPSLQFIGSFAVPLIVLALWTLIDAAAGRRNPSSMG
jgi:hypothetical protein